MARKRRGRPVHGWLVLDKPLQMSSAQAVARVRRLLDAEKAGHGGTLDPLATGVLPVALGEATKTVAWAMEGSKTYRFTVRWGEARATDDAEGGVTEVSPVRPNTQGIAAVLPRFTGEVLQRPPAFSALKVGGERAYDLARAGEAVPLEPRRVRIESLRLLATPDADHAEFEAVVGKGTYIRALARDIAEALGTVGHVAALRRTRVGPFREAQAISLDNLNTLVHSPRPLEHLLPVETALDDIPALAVTEAEADRLRCGQAVLPLRPSDRAWLLELGDGQSVRATCEKKLVALARVADGTLRPVRVLNH
ncbi:MAG TPA: tRNA pseudouridine(55) synthase TruB [Stellaceae bacterium]|nr:tRNA pseudouridine(55) synthase TruB [Stellaceae bacterium]